MARYIDADDFLYRLSKKQMWNKDNGLKEAMIMIGEQPTADVVEVTKVVEMLCKIKTNIIKNVSIMIENDFSERNINYELRMLKEYGAKCKRVFVRTISFSGNAENNNKLESIEFSLIGRKYRNNEIVIGHSSKECLRIFKEKYLLMGEKMKTEKWYDVKCEICGSYLSSDFERGMQPSRESAIKEAKEEGFKVKDGKNVCPCCQ